MDRSTDGLNPSSLNVAKIFQSPLFTDEILHALYTISAEKRNIYSLPLYRVYKPLIFYLLLINLSVE